MARGQRQPRREALEPSALDTHRAAPRSAAVDYETGEMTGTRSRTDFAGSRSRKARRGTADPERGVGGDRRRGVAEMQAGLAARGGHAE
jgi:hypothetical protein